jgi:hypothetical protein
MNTGLLHFLVHIMWVLEVAADCNTYWLIRVMCTVCTVYCVLCCGCLRRHVVQVLTNGLYTPTLHRVLNTAASTPRVSVPFFYEPCYEAVVQPLPQFCRWARP